MNNDMNKICRKCNKILSIEEFYKDKNRPDGYDDICKTCKNEYQRKLKSRPDQKLKQSEHDKQHYKNNKEYHKTKSKQWREQHQVEIQQYSQQYREKNREYFLNKSKEHKLKNRKKYLKYYKNYMKTHRVERNQYENERYKNNPMVRLRKSISASIRYSLKYNNCNKLKNNKKWEDLVGYDVEKLKQHLETLFEKNMTWENYGNENNKWVIDHIKPISWFKFNSCEEEEFKKCWSLDNLQPMWFNENNLKSNKYEGKYKKDN